MIVVRRAARRIAYQKRKGRLFDKVDVPPKTLRSVPDKIARWQMEKLVREGHIRLGRARSAQTVGVGKGARGLALSEMRGAAES